MIRNMPRGIHLRGRKLSEEHKRKMKGKFMFYTPDARVDFYNQYELLLDFIEEHKEKYVIFHDGNLWVDKLITPDWRILLGTNAIVNYFVEKGFDRRLVINWKYLAYYNEFGTPESISHETKKYTEIYKKLRMNEVSKWTFVDIAVNI